MDIRELRYFAAVFTERNLTAAAKRLFISQPSISTAITSLEAELGTALFIRHKKGVAPTAAAEQFHTIARRIIDEADAAKKLFRMSVRGPGGAAKPSLRESAIRNAFTLLAIIPYLGWLLAFIAYIIIAVTISTSPTKQGKHDELAGGTQVVRD